MGGDRYFYLKNWCIIMYSFVIITMNICTFFLLRWSSILTNLITFWGYSNSRGVIQYDEKNWKLIDKIYFQVVSMTFIAVLLLLFY